MADETGNPKENNRKEPQPPAAKDSSLGSGADFSSSNEDRIRKFEEYLLDIGVRI